MKRKILCCVLLGTVSFHVGCYSTGPISKDDLRAKAEPVDITVLMKDSLEYKFLSAHYRLQGDSLYGSGVRKQNMSSDIVLDARLSLKDIATMETSEFDLGKTIGLCAGIGLVGLVVIAYINRPIDSPTIVIMAH